MRLFLAMIIITTIEVILISKVGSAIGFFNTFLLIIITAVFGSWQLRQQWSFVIGKVNSLQSEPSQALLEALVLLICGVLLITPGFLTDIIGFLGLTPFVREHFVAALRKNSGAFMSSNFRMYTRGNRAHNAGMDDSPFSGNSQRGDREDSTIIEGEFERKDSDDSKL
ncbi:MAG: FxsA family protein [Gammaproteobacteria bacterium]|nr:FxsA family protein [Gammaproteobacteria bacterium]